MKGELENELLKLGEEEKEMGFEVFVARPGFVMEEGAAIKAWLVGLVGKSVFMNDLVGSLVEVAFEGLFWGCVRE